MTKWIKLFLAPALFFSAAVTTGWRLALISLLMVFGLGVLGYQLHAHIGSEAALVQAMQPDDTAARLATLDAARIDLYLFLAILSAGLLYFLLGFFLHWRRSIAVLRSQCQAVRAGELDYCPERLSGCDELTELQGEIAAVATEFKRILAAMSESASEVYSASRELKELSERERGSSENQARAVASMASASVQTSASIAQLAEMAKWMEGVAERSHQQALEGSEGVSGAIDAVRQVSPTVDRALSQVNELGERSASINAIIDLIQEIAEQTNLLALNAAIEAARAGEHGRGFAVVSDEVRQLASRTHEATDQVRKIVSTIQQSVAEIVATTQEANTLVAESVERANAASSDLGGIQDEVKSTLEATRNMRTVVEEQSVAAQEITDNIATVREMAEQSRADIEEAAATAIYLEQLSRRVLRGLPGARTSMEDER